MDSIEEVSKDEPMDHAMELNSSKPSGSAVLKPESSTGKKNVTPKGKKRKKAVRDQTAPRQPLTGYIRFLNDRRESVRNESPNLPFAEITKLLAGEWMNLPADDKQQYLDAAEQDRERYLQELSAYKKTDAYRIFTQKQANKKQKEELQDEEIPEKEVSEHTFSGFDISIFTEEFLDHNKAREAELRLLRKNNTDYEQQNAILQKHMENMRAAVDKLTAETQQQRVHNEILCNHLDVVRNRLVTGFAAFPLPGTKETASLQNIDTYINKLNFMLTDTNNVNNVLINAVKEIVSKLDFGD